MSNQNSEFRNPIFWCMAMFLIGMIIGAWGLIKEDCIGGPGCWVGSGLLKYSGLSMIILGGIGGFVLGNRK